MDGEVIPGATRDRDVEQEAGAAHAPHHAGPDVMIVATGDAAAGLEEKNTTWQSGAHPE